MTTDTLVYHSVDQLKAMSLEEITALWELVPTDRQNMYREAYETERSRSGAGSDDAKEMEFIAYLIGRYEEAGFVPIDTTTWIEVPEGVRKAAQENRDPFGEIHTTSTKPTASPLSRLLPIGGLVFMVIMVGSMMFKQNDTKAASSQTVTVTLTPSATPLHTVTPTPLALEALDGVIQAGNTNNNTSSNTVVYPVNLQVFSSNAETPRVFAVQRRLVSVAEWSYSSDPDTASYLAGLVIRPVVGIPYSDTNAGLFSQISDGTRFTLQMNTGVTLAFQFRSRAIVARSDTSLFRQAGPGLVLVLIGQRDDSTGLLTADRQVIYADYRADLELAGGSLNGPTLEPMPTDTPTPSATPAQRLDVNVVSALVSQNTLTVRLWLYNGRNNALPIDSTAIWAALGYAPHPSGPQVFAHLDPFTVEPYQAADLTLVFAWHNEPYATLRVTQDYQFALELQAQP